MRLKDLFFCEFSSSTIEFQFLLVRLKVSVNETLIFREKFQFLLVRLKGLIVRINEKLMNGISIPTGAIKSVVP